MKNIEIALKQFGLSSLEIEVYVILLELGSVPVSTIAKKGHLKRTNIYNILEKLSQKGLISEFQKGSVRFFHATEPQKLVYLQEQNKKKIERNITQLQEMLPLLESMRNPLSMKPKVRFYQGEEGLNLLEEILQNEAFDGYFNPAITYKYFPQAVEDFLKSSQEKKTKIRELIVASPETKKYIRKIKNPNHQYKILPKQYYFASDNFVFGNKVAFISYLEGSIAVVIESEDIAMAQKVAFELMWKGAGMRELRIKN